jgi:type IV pilus assembly protein PilM
LALLNKRDLFLGIDISPSSVKLVELSRSDQRFRVEAMAIEPLPEGAMEDRNPSDLEGLATAIKHALKVSGTRQRKAAVAVPTSSVITRVIPMPAEFGEEEIAANIQIDASQYIPFPLEEIYLDFQVQGLSKASADTQDVMLVASRQENVDLRRDALQDAGLAATVVDVEAYALENTFQLLAPEPRDSGVKGEQREKTKDDYLTALVDIGATLTTLYVLRGEKVVFTREQAFGGDQLTTSIAEAYDLPKERAEQVKRSGQLPDDYPVRILTPYLELAAEQIGQALQFYFASDPYHASRNSVDSIILVGGCALVPGLDRVVTDRLDVPTLIGNPFVSMGNAPRVNRHTLLRDGPLFAVACGLALRSFD